MDRIRVDLDRETAERLRDLAAEERRPTADQAAVLLAKAIAAEERRRKARKADRLSAAVDALTVALDELPEVAET